ncbi:arsenate reductase ArsC [Spongiibacter taiwanensis]|uniref:arsenate reductase ArsC n=1 Tax=Spongiibacter taiwanensis TaxID=1748242 RepID=UPI002034F09A|nr:arsenate reductase ArsC [Spongiibacter taiwanensis]USA42178.1 arsenate reductase ArsC [Spongiibacter taiwanensis]
MKILFICTHNRCRSILSEAICNHVGGAELQGVSAGSQPVGEVHPLSLKFLAERGVSTAGLRSKSWQDFADDQPDLAITVCDSAAGESCPLWMGNCPKVHWGLPDPSRLEGDENTLREAFFAVMDCIEARLKALLATDLSNGDAASIKAVMASIAEQIPAPQFTTGESH